MVKGAPLKSHIKGIQIKSCRTALAPWSNMKIFIERSDRVAFLQVFGWPHTNIRDHTWKGLQAAQRLYFVSINVRKKSAEFVHDEVNSNQQLQWNYGIILDMGDMKVSGYYIGDGWLEFATICFWQNFSHEIIGSMRSTSALFPLSINP